MPKEQATQGDLYRMEKLAEQGDIAGLEKLLEKFDVPVEKMFALAAEAEAMARFDELSQQGKFSRLIASISTVEVELSYPALRMLVEKALLLCPEADLEVALDERHNKAGKMNQANLALVLSILQFGDEENAVRKAPEDLPPIILRLNIKSKAEAIKKRGGVIFQLQADFEQQHKDTSIRRPTCTSNEYLKTVRYRVTKKVGVP